MKYLGFTLLAFTLIISCKKKDSIPDATIPSDKLVTLITTSATPGQLVLAQANFQPIKSSTKIGVEGILVDAFALDSNKIMFIMPTLPTGNALIDFSNLGFSKKLPINVGTYTTITQPDIVLNSTKLKIDQIITKFNDYISSPIIKLDPKYNDILAYLKQNLNSNFASLSNQDQITLAYFLQNNIPDPNLFTLDTLNNSFYQRTYADSDPSKRLISIGLLLAKNIASVLIFANAGTLLAYSPDPTLITKLLALGFFTKAIVETVKLLSALDELGILKGLQTEISSYTMRTQADTMRLVKDIPRNIIFTGTYRNLIQSDKSSTVPFFQSLFSAKNIFEKIYSDISNIYNKIISWFTNTPPNLPIYFDPIRTTINTKTFALPGSKITLKNFSDPAIQINYSGNETSVTIQASSSTITQNKAFSFNANYVDDILGVNLVKKVDALYQTSTSTTLTTSAITSITATSAVSGGNITNDGGSPITARGVCWSTSQNPTIGNSKTSDGIGTGNFTSNIIGLMAGTSYYVKAYATNSTGTAYGNEVSFVAGPNNCPSSVTDIDGNIYNTINIGSQCWMQENLKVTRYRNGTPIATLTDSAWAKQWENPATGIGAYCDYNKNAANGNTFGHLYNWFAVNNPAGLCPAGWHIPSNSEWTVLATFLGGEGVAGGKMKATTLWNLPNVATNSSGFTAFGGGYRSWGGPFDGMGTDGFFWSSTGGGGFGAWDRRLQSGSLEIVSAGGNSNKGNGFSCRCIRD